MAQASDSSSVKLDANYLLPSEQQERPPDMLSSTSALPTAQSGREKPKYEQRSYKPSGKFKKRQEKSRTSWSNNSGTRRERNEETKRRRVGRGPEQLPIYATEFSREEIEGETRRPKRKMAILFGYSGTGYKGLQLSDKEKTIEGELFQAFVAAGAVSKANADDPKKTSLVRCARTDKGVHAAGNVLSMKVIVEDPDIVQAINGHLSSQIRVWGMIRVSGSFSAYRLCDSRIYEYLIPTHCFLPPHPKTYLGRKLVELAQEADDLDGYLERQEEVASFWNEIEIHHIKPMLDKINPTVRDEALRIIFDGGSRELKAEGAKRKRDEGDNRAEIPFSFSDEKSSMPPGSEFYTPLEQACRTIKAAYQHAKISYRITPKRLSRIQSCLSHFVGTHNYHNYTIQKSFRDPSAQRVIISFNSSKEPLVMNNTEWLSLKVHGQSFMMHQIRKMVSMCALVVRSGTPETRINESFRGERYNIPKAPGLGLLLERPIFDSYNKNLKNKGGIERAELNFARYESEMINFKAKEIYERIFREEEQDSMFHSFFSSLDSLHSSQLLYLSSLGHSVTEKISSEQDPTIREAELSIGSEDESGGSDNG